MSFTKELRTEVHSIWEASFHHPFVTKLGDGSLSLKCFRYYVLQDSYYLSHFARVQALGAAKATDLHTTASMANHAQNTYQAELSLHRNFSVKSVIYPCADCLCVYLTYVSCGL
jgi:thiaminase (transcriptional activator TenA)